MDPHHLDQMLLRLRPLLRNRQQARVMLYEYWRHRMAIVWEIGHVFRAANERRIALTTQEAETILSSLITKHDRQYGLHWQMLIEAIQDSGLGRQLTKAELSQFIEHDIITVQR